MKGKLKPHFGKLSLLTLLILSQNNSAQGVEKTTIAVDLPKQALSSSLVQLAESTHTKLIFADPLLNGLNADPIKGNFTIEQVLDQLLRKHGLEYQLTSNGVFAIKKTQPHYEDNSVFELGEVVVTNQKGSGKLNSRDIVTSVDIMYADKIENQNVLTAYDLFHRMPGVQVTQFGQGITTGKMSFRGFNGEGRVNAVKLLIDGIPSNTNSGDTYFIDSLFPLDIESIEVVRGTNDPRYGLHAFAGNVGINTSTGGNYTKGRVSYGSFNTYDIQSGLGYEKDGFSQNYAISYRASDGYREHSQSDKNSFSGKWTFTPDNEKYKLGLNARWSEADAQEPGYLTYQEQLQSTTQSMARNNTDGGKRQLGQFSSFFDAKLNDKLFWSNKVYTNTFKDQRFVLFDPCCAQVERDRDELQYGAITALTYHPVINWLNDFSLETGMDFQQQQNSYQQYRTTKAIQRTPANATNVRNDEKWDFLNYGGYVQAVIKPTQWLKITPGYRADRIDAGNFLNFRPGSNGSYPVNNYGIISQPKIGAVITPLDGYSLYGNWGKTFQVGVGSATFRSPTAANVAPSINDGWEVGFKVKPWDWTEGRIAYWQQNASNEMSRNLSSNAAIYLGSTARQGVDIELKIYPTDNISLWSSYSLQEAKIKTAGTYVLYSYEYKAGNSIVNTPDYLFSAGLDYQITKDLRSSFWTTGQGNYFVDQANQLGKYGGYSLLNLDLGYQVNKNVDLQFQAKNLANVHREYVWFDETYGSVRQPLFSPGDGIAFYGAVSVKYSL
ncbi:TonB-dependent receptor [Methylomonas sp. AM2-LC]|uniref:TonB-dependent receptor n=1 Tax=Methylomonas sp. AM2-LC TaxID=3153301 RepID=UPI0032648C3A